MLDFVEPEVHQNDRSYICELSGLLLIHYAKILPNRRLHGIPQITHKTVKIWGGGLVNEQVYGHLTGTMRYIQNGRRIVMR